MRVISLSFIAALLVLGTPSVVSAGSDPVSRAVSTPLVNMIAPSANPPESNGDNAVPPTLQPDAAPPSDSSTTAVTSTTTEATSTTTEATSTTTAETSTSTEDTSTTIEDTSTTIATTSTEAARPRPPSPPMASR